MYHLKHRTSPLLVKGRMMDQYIPPNLDNSHPILQNPVKGSNQLRHPAKGSSTYTVQGYSPHVYVPIPIGITHRHDASYESAYISVAYVVDVEVYTIPCDLLATTTAFLPLIVMTFLSVVIQRLLLKNVLDSLVWADKTLLNAGTYLVGPMPLNGVITYLECVIITWYNRACQPHDNTCQITKTKS